MSEATPYPRRQSRRLSRYLTLAFVALAVFPVVVLTLLLINNVIRTERERVFEHLEAVADAQTQALERWINDTEDRLFDNVEDSVMAGAITTLTTTTESGSAAAAYADARGLFAEHALTVIDDNPFDQLYLAGLDGVVRGSSLPQLLNHDLSGEPWFQTAQSSAPGDITLVGPIADPFDGQESLYFVLAVQAEGSSAGSGLLVGRTGLEALQTIMATGPYLGQTEEFFLVRSGRRYVTPPSFTSAESLASDEIISTALSGVDGSGTWEDYRGEPVLGVYRWIEPLNIALVGKQDVREALASVRPIIVGNAVIGGLVACLTLLVGLLSARRVRRLFKEMTAAVEQVRESEYQLQIPRTPFLETNQLAESFNSLIAQLRAMTSRQEDVLRSRTRQLEISARLGQAIARETDLESLLNTTVEMIRDQLGHYHAQVFLLDDLHRNAVLRASTGAAGQELLRRGHRLAVGSESVIGQVTTLGEPVLASDTEHAEFWLPNPLLPRTRAELAVPLRLGDRTIGALDVQSVDPNVFDEMTIAALQTVADQLAVAIRNAQLLEEKEGLLSASVQLTQTLTRDGWERYAEIIDDPSKPIGYRYDLSEISALSAAPAQAAQGHDLSLPIALRGEVIGQLQAELPGDGALSEDDRNLVGQVLDRVALALENARLFEQTQHSLAETNRLYEASQRIAVANTLEELSNALIDISAFERVDRTIVIVTANSQPEDPSRMLLEVKGTRFKDVSDPLYNLPNSFLASDHPLGFGLEYLQVGDVVINDVENADIDDAYKDALRQMGVKAQALFAISPMLVGATTLGWLILHSVNEPQAFRDSDVRFLQTAIYQASTALEGIRLVELTQARARRLQAANEVTRTSTSILDTDILLPMIVRQISEAFSYYHTQIFLIDPAGEWAVLRASTGEVGQELLRRGHKLMVGSHSVIGQVASRGEPVIALDTDTDPIHHRNELLPDTRAEMAIPLKTGERIIGALDVQSTSPNAFDPEAQAILQSLADQVAVTLENAQLFQEIQDRVAELSTVNLVSQAVSRTDTLEDLYEVVTRELLRTFGTQYAVMGVLDDKGQLDLPIIIREGRRMSVLAPPPVDERLIRQVMESQEILLLNEDVWASIEAAGVEVSGDSPKSLLIAPLMLAADAIGAICLVDMNREQAFGNADVRQLGTLSAYIAVKIRNTRLVELAQARARRLQAINEVTRTSTSILDTDILLPMIVRQISEAFGYYHTQIFLIDPAGEWAVLRASTGEVGQELLRRGHKLMVGSHSVIGQVTSRKVPVIALDTDTDPFHHRNELLPDTRAEMAIPLKTGGRTIGALDVQSTSPNAFDPEAQAILQSLADQVAVTLENTQLFQEIQERVAELSTVNLVSQSVSRTDTLEDLYEVVTRELLRTFGTQYAVMGVLNDKGQLDLPIIIREGRRMSVLAPPPIDERLIRQVMDDQEILLFNEDVRKRIEATGVEVSGDSPKSLLIAPLMLADDAIGAIGLVDMDREQAFRDADVRQLGTLSAYIAVKIRNAELLDETQQRADELGFLFDMTRAAVTSADLTEALQGVAEVVSHEIEGAESVVIYLANSDAGCLDPEAAVGYGRELIARRKHVNWGDGPVGEIATRRQSRVIDDIETESYDLGEDERLRSAVLVPLQAGHQFSGVLAVESTRPYSFGEWELRLLETASGTLNAVIQNARLLEQITQAHEQLRELDQLKSQFLANMSHELRTPLNSIIGFSRVMLKGIDGPLNDLQSQDLDTIHESGQHLLGLINNILDMSKIEAGKMELQMEYTDLEEIVEAAVTTGHGLIQDKPIELIKEVDPGLPQVYCDPIRVRQILLNLVSNAAKFTAKGTITIRATRVASDPANSIPAHVQIDVSDTGIGIAEEDRSKIFEAFRQVDGSATRQAGGTGLGLAISKEFVDMHQGWIWLESEEGAGSTFCFSLPIHPAGQEDPDLIVMPRYDDDRPIVLAVDDEPGVIDLYRRYLEKEGYGIAGLRSANDLLFHIRQIQPFVVLLDLHLPGRDGWDAWDDIKRAEDTQNLPVIVCSIDDDRQQGLARGVEGYLVKPIIEDDLLEAIQRVQRAAAANGNKPQFTLDRLLLIAPPEAAQDIQEALGESLGCTIQTAATGRDGLQAALDQQPDLILMDTELPDMDGYGLLVAMRSQAETSHFPVILLTREMLSADRLATVDPERTRFLNRDMYPGSQLVDGLLSELSNLQSPT